MKLNKTQLYLVIIALSCFIYGIPIIFWNSLNTTPQQNKSLNVASIPVPSISQILGASITVSPSVLITTMIPTPGLTTTTAPTTNTPSPTQTQLPIYYQPTIIEEFSCNCSKTCSKTINSCREAQYLLNTCGCKRLDADKDGVACDAAPLNCQN